MPASISTSYFMSDSTLIFKVECKPMDTPLETREAAIERIRKPWGNNRGTYWSELRKAKLTTVEVFPEYSGTNPIVLPDLDKKDQAKKSKK